MIKRVFCVLTAVALTLVVAMPLTASADVCDDVNDIANSWNDMANAVNELDLDYISVREAEEIDAAIEAAWDYTVAFADMLEDYGDVTEERLGMRLNRALDYLYDAEGINETVDAMDSVVDVLDSVVDYCDMQ